MSAVSRAVEPAIETMNGQPISKPSRLSQTHFKLSLSSEQYFHQDSACGKDAASLGTVYDFPKCFGLKSNDWKGFGDILRLKNAEKPGKVEYVLVFLARHGQGYHNIGEEYLGSQVWKKISTLSPEQAIHEQFPDTRLTPVGQHQADTLSHTIQKLLDNEANPMPWPQAFYVSPLHRALETSYRTWAPLSGTNRPYRPQIQDSLREQMYIECCNQRSSRAEMAKFTFTHSAATMTTTTSTPARNIHEEETISANLDNASHADGNINQAFGKIFNIQPSSLGAFTEEDTFFAHQRHTAQRNETENETTMRAYSALTHIFAQNWGKGVQQISITTHAGFMSGIYQIFGMQHDDVPRFPTGIVVPVLIRVEKVDEPVRLGEVALSHSHWGDGTPGKIGSLANRTVDQVLDEIRDPDVYHQLIQRVETAKRAGLANDPGWRDRLKADLSPLEKVIVRALI